MCDKPAQGLVFEGAVKMHTEVARNRDRLKWIFEISQ